MQVAAVANWCNRSSRGIRAIDRSLTAQRADSHSCHPCAGAKLVFSVLSNFSICSEVKMQSMYRLKEKQNRGKSAAEAEQKCSANEGYVLFLLDFYPTSTASTVQVSNCLQRTLKKDSAECKEW